MLVASLGPGLAAEFGMPRALAEDAAKTFVGRWNRWCASKKRRRQGAAAVWTDCSGNPSAANWVGRRPSHAPHLRGEHYDGFHAFMALRRRTTCRNCPRSANLSGPQVLYRNSSFSRTWRPRQEKLRPLKAVELSDGAASRKQLAEACAPRLKTAEQRVRRSGSATVESAFDDLLQFNVEDHPGSMGRLAWRAWEMLDLVGKSTPTLCCGSP